MSEENKTVELKDEELEKVSGGITQNADDTYNIQDGEKFNRNSKICHVIGNYPNATLDTNIHYLWIEDENLRDGESIDTLSFLLTNSTLGRSL